MKSRTRTTTTRTMTSGPCTGSALLLRGFAAIGALGQRRLQRLQLGIDLVGVAKLRNLFLERLGGGAEAQRVGVALGEVGMALEHVEARKGVVDLRPRIELAKAAAILRAF